MEAGTDIQTAWDKGMAFVPSREPVYSPANLPPITASYPVVIFMHGCSGITAEGEVQWGKYLRDLGYVVLVPNSVARRDRGPVCDTTSAQHYGRDTYHRLRQQEIDFALEKVLSSGWARKDRVFLMGHSDGGVAAALTSRSEFRGIIISAWTCTTKYTAYTGIRSPKEVPVLSLMWSWDRWYPSGHLSGTCESSLSGRRGSKHVTLDGYGHNTYPSPVARQEVRTFLEADRNP